MLLHDSLSAVQFITALIAIAVALTGRITLILTNRRLRAERAVPVIQAIRSIGTDRIEIVRVESDQSVAVREKPAWFVQTLIRTGFFHDSG